MLLGFSLASLAAVAAMGACLTDPPPDLPLDTAPPEIDDNAIDPAEGTITSLPPGGFTMAVAVADPTQLCQWSVYDKDTNQQYVPCTPCDTESIHDGTVPVHFDVTGGAFDPTVCHNIVFTVGGTFADTQCRFGGSDVATWFYAPPGGSCVSYDASALGDGAFPDAASDALPLIGDSGGHP
jgi:hypothetical protein